MGTARWRWWYVGGLAALWVTQSFVRLVFSRAAIGVARYDLALHIGLILATLAGVAFIVALFPDTRYGRRMAAIAGIAILAPLHAGATIFDIVAMVMFHITRMAAPFAMFRTSPALVRSLLDSIGFDTPQLVMVIVVAVTAHALLYLPVAGLLVDLARRLMAWGAPLPGKRRLALRWLAPPGVLALLVMHHARPMLWIHANSLVVAPPALMSGRGTPSTAGQPESDLPAARPLVLIIVDTLRRDRMGVYNPPLANTPFLSGLAARGKLKLFDPAFSTCTFSYCGIMSVLSSHSWDDFGQRPATIIDALGRHHYRSYAIMTGRNSAYSNIVTAFGGPIESLRDEPLNIGGHADDRHIITWLREAHFPDPRHSFVYFHLMSAHYGAVIQPRFTAAARGDPDGLPYARGYDARVRQTDAMLRDIIATLAERGLGDALVIVTADHGERLGEDGLLLHGGDPDPPVIQVPLIVYDPRGPPTWPTQTISSQIDVAPTLLAAVGGTPPPEWRGIALQRTAKRPAVPIGTFDTAGLVGIVAGRQVEYRCDRQSGRERITLLDAHGGGTSLPLARVPHLLSLLRHWQRDIAPVPAGRCRH